MQFILWHKSKQCCLENKNSQQILCWIFFQPLGFDWTIQTPVRKDCRVARSRRRIDYHICFLGLFAHLFIIILCLRRHKRHNLKMEEYYLLTKKNELSTWVLKSLRYSIFPLEVFNANTVFRASWNQWPILAVCVK